MSRRSKEAYVTLKAPGPLGSSVGTRVTVGGTDITNQIKDLTLHMGVNDLHTMEVTYLCHEGVRFSGEVMVHHECPINEEG